MTTPVTLKMRLLAASCALVVIGLACGSGGSGSGGAGTGTDSGMGRGRDAAGAGDVDVDVDIEQFEYRPAIIEVAVGDKVTWQNHDAIIHWVTAGVPEAPTGEFEEPMPEVGDTATLTFDEPGEFRYFCTRHEFMLGTVVVE